MVILRHHFPEERNNNKKKTSKNLNILKQRLFLFKA